MKVSTKNKKIKVKLNQGTHQRKILKNLKTTKKT